MFTFLLGRGVNIRTSIFTIILEAIRRHHLGPSSAERLEEFRFIIGERFDNGLEFIALEHGVDFLIKHFLVELAANFFTTSKSNSFLHRETLDQEVIQNCDERVVVVARSKVLTVVTFRRVDAAATELQLEVTVLVFQRSLTRKNNEVGIRDILKLFLNLAELSECFLDVSILGPIYFRLETNTGSIAASVVIGGAVRRGTLVGEIDEFIRHGIVFIQHGLDTSTNGNVVREHFGRRWKVVVERLGFFRDFVTDTADRRTHISGGQLQLVIARKIFLTKLETVTQQQTTKMHYCSIRFIHRYTTYLVICACEIMFQCCNVFRVYFRDFAVFLVDG